MLHSYLEVVTPTAMKGASDTVHGIYQWEAKVTALANRYGQD